MKKVIYLIMILMLLGCGKEKAKIEVDLEKPLVVLGDSLAVGYGSSRGFTHYLKEEMNQKVINLGQNGQTSGYALKRVDEVKSYDPSIVILELGGNDYLKRIPARETEINLAEIIEELDDGKRIIFLTEFYPTNHLLSLFIKVPKKEYDDMFKRLSKGENVYMIDKIWDDVWRKEMSDEVHPNTRGYEIMGQNILESLKKILSAKAFKNS